MCDTRRTADPGPLTGLLDLAGRWSLQRRLVDRTERGVVFSRADGWLDIEAAGAGVRWYEHGSWYWQGRELAVSRELRGMLRADGWWLEFTDGRAFHPWRLDQQVLHPCGADTYVAWIRMDRAAQRLRICWDVSGPAKSQRIYTELRRVTR